MQLDLPLRPTRMYFVVLALISISVAGCAGADPDDIDPPAHNAAGTAQVNVKHQFRVVGGGSGQRHDLFDIGSGIEYNASVPTDNTAESHLVRIHEAISPELLREIAEGRSVRFAPMDGVSEVRVRDSFDPDGDNPPGKVVDHFDESLLGKPLLRKIDMYSGEAVTDAKASFPFQYAGLNASFLSDPRGKLVRVKLRLVYDTRDDVLYRFISETKAMCSGSELADNVREVSVLLARQSGEWDAVESRPDDFMLAELCGLVAPFPIRWNAYHVGTFPGFSLKTWERAPGAMRLYGVIGHQRTYAEEQMVEAGAQYIGVYDPNRRTFVVRPY